MLSLHAKTPVIVMTGVLERLSGSLPNAAFLEVILLGKLMHRFGRGVGVRLNFKLIGIIAEELVLP